MDFSKYVEQEKIKARLANIEEVRKNINEPWVQEKIDKYLISFDGFITKEEVEQSILVDRVAASHFIKDPGKQNISEKLAIQILGVEKLPSAGKKSIRFNDEGDIVSTAVGNTKSADFLYKSYYATQKYTVNFGGAQDNQRNDVIDFLKRGSIKHRVAAIVDGEYWDKWRDELILQFKNNPNVLITSVTEITNKD